MEKASFSSCRLYTNGLLASIAVLLIMLADIRRAFLGFSYTYSSSWASFSYWHLLLLAAGVLGLFFFKNRLTGLEPSSTSDKQMLASLSKKFLWMLFVFLAADLLIFYRGIAMTRIAQAGATKGPALPVYSATAELIPFQQSAFWMKPAALTVNYLAAVWHATLIGLLLASLSMIGMSRVLAGGNGNNKLKDVAGGTLWALPQPFCSCCASPVAAGMIKSGSPVGSALSFLVASPMLNITAIILAVMLLPLKFAVLRVAAGLIMAIPVSYFLSWAIERYSFLKAPEKSGGAESRSTKWAGRLFDRYCNLFHVERAAAESAWESPGKAFQAWLTIFKRLAKITVPSLIIGSAIASLFAVWATPMLGNTLSGVLAASMIGVILMIATWTELPVAGVMASAGLTGPAAAFLITLPAVSLPCLMILSGALRNARVAVVLGLVVFVLGLTAGIAFI